VCGGHEKVSLREEITRGAGKATQFQIEHLVSQKQETDYSIRFSRACEFLAWFGGPASL